MKYTFKIKNKWDNTEYDITPDNKNKISIDLNIIDLEYHSLIEKILKEGIWKENRTGVKTLSIFGPQIVFKNVGKNFPLITTKKVHLKSIIGELLWFLSGSTNTHELRDKYGVTIWDEWGDDETGELGPVYGHQWVNWTYWKYDPIGYKPHLISGHLKENSINQLQNIIDTLKTNPDDRRMIVSAWNVAEIDQMALPPCHWSYQFYSVKYPNEEKRRLNLLWNQRSVDVGLGLPFNIASYALLLIMIAQQVDMIPGDIIGNLGDTHIYENHINKLLKQLSRDSKGNIPKMIIKKQKDLWSYAPEHFSIKNYNPHPNIKMPVAI